MNVFSKLQLGYNVMSQKMKICLVGCSPSSGSTFLADLLDSSRKSVAGPEIGFFANRNLYGDSWKDIVTQTISTPTAHSSSVGVYEKFLPAYGLNMSQFYDFVQSKDDFSSFISDFAARYVAFRGKSIPAVFFEKTPQNIFVANKFIKKYPNGHFIFIVRNPVSVIKSLQKRGFSAYVATLSWLVACSAFFSIENSDKVILVKYEDVLDRPYEIVSEVFSEVGNMDITPEEIEKDYKSNTYRSVCETRISSWSTENFGEIKKKKKLDLNKEEKSLFLEISNSKLSKQYSNFWGIEDISFKEAIIKLGYERDFYSLLEGGVPFSSTQNSIEPTYREKKLLIGKCVRSGAWRSGYNINKLIMPLEFL